MNTSIHSILIFVYFIAVKYTIVNIYPLFLHFFCIFELQIFLSGILWLLIVVCGIHNFFVNSATDPLSLSKHDSRNSLSSTVSSHALLLIYVYNELEHIPFGHFDIYNVRAHIQFYQFVYMGENSLNCSVKMNFLLCMYFLYLSLHLPNNIQL